MKTVSGKKVDLGPQYDNAIVDSPDSSTYHVSRFKGQTFTPKVTSPGVVTMKIGTAKPSRPQGKQSMGVGGTKARMRHKGRVDPKAADPHDPGQTPFASTKVNWPTNDAKAKKGYVVGKAWPVKSKTRSGGNADGLQEGIGADGPY